MGHVDRERPLGAPAGERPSPTQLASRIAAIKADRDFLSRQAALERVEKENPAVKKYVEFFLLFLIAIDLVAIMLKLTHLLSTGGLYEKSPPQGSVRWMRVDAHRLQEAG